MIFDDEEIILGSLVGTSKCQIRSEFKGLPRKAKKMCKNINKQWKGVKVKKNDPEQEEERAQARKEAKVDCENATYNIQGNELKICEWR